MYSDSCIERVSSRMSGFRDSSICWPWPASRTAAGYGQLTYRVDGKTRLAYAHRVAYLVANGDPAIGKEVCHRCDNPACFNPSHLFASSHAGNMADMANKSRGNSGKRLPIGDRHWTRRRPELVKRGSTNAKAKLTEPDVVLILASERTGASLAREYGVTEALISAIRKGKVWKHLQPSRSANSSGSAL